LWIKTLIGSGCCLGDGLAVSKDEASRWRWQSLQGKGLDMVHPIVTSGDFVAWLCKAAWTSQTVV